MADVLSQSQIDALLKSMQDGPPKEEKEEPKVVEVSVQESPKKEEAPAKEDNFSKYDFYSPRKFTKEKIRLLKSIFDISSKRYFPNHDGYYGFRVKGNKILRICQCVP